MIKTSIDPSSTRNLLDAAIKIGLLAVWLIWCFRIIQPFIEPVAWGIIIAVAIFPVYRGLVEALKGRYKLSALIVTLGLLILLFAPSTFIGKSLVENVQSFASELHGGNIDIPPPSEGINDWPIIGEPLADIWLLASENLEEAANKFAPEIKAFGVWLVDIAKGAGIGFLQFFIAVILAGILLPNASAGHRVALNIAERLAGDRGKELTLVAEQTIRSVALGILGVAIIQAMLAGLGFYVVNVPAAGFWTFLCLLLGIIQIGANPVTIPIMIYVFLNSDTTTGILYVIWSIFVGVIDNILKPFLLGRGVDLPMLVIFVGAIGGLLHSGIIGLFLGAIILALGYKLFQMWIEPVQINEAEKV